ncbi:DUF3592 domain-containing protein [Streptomyces sp. NPDC089919]|uniref:DUF3592 domain-containing protein n=1 Tax=Streptomyces sp. NPDC089919 TaxID=3155188 RepID=UPI00342E3037
MDWGLVRLLGCAVCAVWALVGYGLALAGATRGQRAVRVTGRVVEVCPPAHGAAGTAGIPVVLAFPDPATGREHTLPYDGEHGMMLETAWIGREVTVLHPPGEPGRFKVAYSPEDGLTGRGWPHFAAFLLYAGLVTDTAIRHGYPWALLGGGAALTLFAATALPHELRVGRRESAQLATVVPVRAEVIAVTQTVQDYDDGPMTVHRLFVRFTTGGGTTVTARLADPPKDPARAFGGSVTLHYAPDDLTYLTLDPAAARRAVRRSLLFVIALLLAATATTTTGALLL